jgi:hypothetical protein
MSSVTIPIGRTTDLLPVRNERPTFCSRSPRLARKGGLVGLLIARRRCRTRQGRANNGSRMVRPARGESQDHAHRRRLRPGSHTPPIWRRATAGARADRNRGKALARRQRRAWSRCRHRHREAQRRRSDQSTRPRPGLRAPADGANARAGERRSGPALTAWRTCALVTGACRKAASTGCSNLARSASASVRFA